eukprot:2238394-Pleurochrysis_carterae.AAC.1
MQTAMHAAHRVVRRHNMYVRRSATRVHRQRAGDSRSCSRTRHVPFVEAAAEDESKAVDGVVRVRGELHSAGSRESTVDAGGNPELSNG